MISDQAQCAGMEMSSWVKKQLFSKDKRTYLDILKHVIPGENNKEGFALFHDFLNNITPTLLADVVVDLPERLRDTLSGNYMAAMVEVACHIKGVIPPLWVQKYKGLMTPYFSSTLPSLRMYLMQSSPPPFRRRNIFIDASIGDRV